jgi:UDP-glucose 4-epimerase
VKALVTGGAGFIGSHLVERLLAEGWSVEVVDDLSTGRLANLSAAREGYPHQVRFTEMDVRAEEIEELFQRCSPEVVFHLAAQADVRVSVADPALDADINVVGSVNVIEAARRVGTRKVVFAASGGTLYGDAASLPVKETAPHVPLSPYGVAKKSVCDYLAAFRKLYGLEFTALALGNVYGPRQDPHGEAGVVAIFAGQLVSGEQCTIFGDGNQTRDFVYVDDVVDAFAKSALKGDGLIVNVGTGKETSVNDLYSTMCAVAGVDRQPVFAPPRAGELERSCLDISRAKAKLGWRPWTSLKDGVAAVIEEARQRL